MRDVSGPVKRENNGVKHGTYSTFAKQMVNPIGSFFQFPQTSTCEAQSNLAGEYCESIGPFWALASCA